MVNIYERALKVKGETMQIDIMIEECSELIRALIKYKRIAEGYCKITAVDNIAEEIADVGIMIEQIKTIFGPSLIAGIEHYQTMKLNRLKERLDKLEVQK